MHLELYKIFVLDLQGPSDQNPSCLLLTKDFSIGYSICSILSNFGRLVLENMIVSPVVALALVALSATSAFGGPVQKPNIRLPRSAAANKAAVVDIFTRSYNAYK